MYEALITGAGGFVSGALASELKATGYQLRLHRRVDGDVGNVATLASVLKGL